MKQWGEGWPGGWRSSENGANTEKVPVALVMVGGALRLNGGEIWPPLQCSPPVKEREPDWFTTVVFFFMTRKAKKENEKKRKRKRTTSNWLFIEFSWEWLNCHSSCLWGLEKKPLPYLGFCIHESFTLDSGKKEGGCKKPREEARKTTVANNLSPRGWGLLLKIVLRLVLSAGFQCLPRTVGCVFSQPGRKND